MTASEPSEVPEIDDDDFDPDDCCEVCGFDGCLGDCDGDEEFGDDGE